MVTDSLSEETCTLSNLTPSTNKINQSFVATSSGSPEVRLETLNVGVPSFVN